MKIEQRFFWRRPQRRARAALALGAVAAGLIAGIAVASPLSGASALRGAGLSPQIQAITDGPAYQHATWGLLQVDAETGREVHGLDPDALFMPGSTAKLFTISATWDTLGPDYRFTTPVYALGAVSDGTLTGNLVLVASGDLDLGGRTTPDGRIDYVGDIDHTDANAADSDASILTPEDPLAGLDSLAQQVRAAGVAQVEGDVLIDDRLFTAFTDIQPTPTPIMVNDNVVDVVTTAGAVGQPPTATFRPMVAPYHLTVNATTIPAGGQTKLNVSSGPDGGIVVSGQIAADARPQLRTVTVDDPARFARTAFIEALGRAGVTVSASATAANQESALPSSASYGSASPVATLVSPPYREYATMILKMSHNLGANLGLCLMAVHAGSTDCGQGFATLRSFLERAGVDPGQVAQGDGRGGGGVDAVTPRAVVDLLQYWLTRPDAADLRATLPILGVDGSLAYSDQGSDSAGKVQAKTGTLVAFDPLNARLMTQAKALAGYLVQDDGRLQVFDLVVNQAQVADFQGVDGVGDDLAQIASMLREGS